MFYLPKAGMKYFIVSDEIFHPCFFGAFFKKRFFFLGESNEKIHYIQFTRLSKKLFVTLPYGGIKR